MKVNVYLNFEGNCAEAFDFYKSVFGGEFDSKMTWGGSAHMMKEEDPSNFKELKAEDAARIMHMDLALTKDVYLMGCDNPPKDFGSCGGMDPEPFTVGNNMQICIQPDSREHADKLIAALSAKGGKVMMPMAETFWKAYFGMCKDAFGITWMFNFPTEEKEEKKDGN